MKLELTLHANLTDKQKRILRTKKQHLVIQGPAGTAKTYAALARGLMKLANDDVEKIIIVRSPVEIRSIGFLPGTPGEKLDPYAAPYIDLLDELSPKLSYRALMQKKMLDFVPTTFLRGTTFHNAYVIADEMQNMSAHELETIVTRLGEYSELVVVGDSGQSDLPRHERGHYQNVLDVLLSMEEFENVEFTVEDIVRSGLVKRYYIAKSELDSGRSIAAQLPRIPVLSERAA
jgi:phosphate starvation-inducible protein PhoH